MARDDLLSRRGVSAPISFVVYDGPTLAFRWTLGSIATENVMSSHLCKRANIVVVSVDYRLAPENPFPAAADDACETFDWVVKEGREVLRVDVDRLAVGGSSRYVAVWPICYDFADTRNMLGSQWSKPRCGGRSSCRSPIPSCANPLPISQRPRCGQHSPRARTSRWVSPISFLGGERGHTVSYACQDDLVSQQLPSVVIRLAQPIPQIMAELSHFR